jgi:UV DNA damage endonuclease
LIIAAMRSDTSSSLRGPARNLANHARDRNKPEGACTLIRIGYACINTKLLSPNRTCRLKNATPEKIFQLASANLAALQRILEWNIAHDIKLFRISSDVIPFGSHPINKVPWRTILSPELEAIGRLIRAKHLRVSMHPGQFTVLNSPRREVVANSVQELEYHAAFLDALAIDDTHKIVIHLGGVYDDKPQSLKRFMETYANLNHRVRARLVIENDERCYTVADALGVSRAVGSPVVFDVFHHRWNPSLDSSSLRKIIERSAATWRKRDGRTKIHYSTQWPGLPPGTHSQSISAKKFHAFYEQIKSLDVDVMLAVKDKERSVLKLMRSLPNLRSAARKQNVIDSTAGPIEQP